MQTDHAFRHFFLRSCYVLLAALWLACLSVIMSRYWAAQPADLTAQKQLQAVLTQQEKDIDLLSGDTLLLQQLSSRIYDASALGRLTGKPYFFFLYRSDTLSFWNTQSVVPTEDILKSTAAEGFQLLSNGYYVWKKKASGRFTCIALIPVKWQYAIENQYLENNFVPGKYSGDDFDITTKQTAHAIWSSDGTFLFSVVHKKNPAHNNVPDIICRLLATLLVLVFVHLMAYYLVHRNFYRGAGFLIVTVTLLRYITYHVPLPFDARQFELFDPAIYGSNSIMSSLGDLLINSLLFLWIVLFIRYYLQDSNPTIYPKNRFLQSLLVLAGITCLYICTLVAGAVISSMVSDSQISFDVVNFFTLSIYSVLGFLILGVVVVVYFFLTQIILYVLQPLLPRSIFIQMLILAVIGLLVFASRTGDTSIVFEECLLGWLFLYIVILLNGSYLRLIASRVSSSRFVFWIFFFSISVTVVIMIENRKKEMYTRQHYAEELSVKMDPSGELLTNTVLTDFRNERLEPLFNRFRQAENNKALKDSLLDVYFSGYKYDAHIYTFDADEHPLYNDDTVSLATLNTLLETKGKSTSLRDLYYYNLSYNKFSYISKKEISDETGRRLGYIFLLATPKEYETDALYPELLLKGYANSIENSPIYAYAVYDHLKLVNSHNDYSFPLQLDPARIPQVDISDRKKEGYNEYWYKSKDRIVVIVRKDDLLLESITLFSYLFCACLVINGFFWLLNILVRSIVRRKETGIYWQSTIRNQVHSTIILISLILFIVVGAATISLFISRYNNNNKEKLTLLIQLMKEDVSNSLNGASSLDLSRADETAYREKLEQIINRISEMHAVDINLYDIDGDLRISSLSLPYTKGIVSYKMDPSAYYHLHLLKEAQYLQQERIGKLSYISDYIPIIDGDGNEVAYLNIPYFASQGKLRQEISNFLITIINLNAFIFLIAGIIAFVITNRITRSFSFLRAKMKEINLGERNEQIVWKRNDEIGGLVNEYNKMVAKLDERAAELAQNEREVAWREMAKQVAHEIKNPLTPMKLSLQYLQRAIHNNADNVQELSESVSKTLVEQIDHLSQIAGDFSQFANITHPKKERFNLNELLASLAHLHWSENDPAILLTPAAEDVFLYADRTHINRLFTNLIQNALQAVPEDRSPVIEIEVERLPDDKVLVRVKDNGTGIGKGQDAAIFAPNFTTKTSGTGLGLAMCKGIVEQNKGAIWFRTTKDKGTVFFVQLPVMPY